MSGEIGYVAYGDSVGWLNHIGRPMPPWKDLPQGIRNAWDLVAAAATNAQRDADAPLPHDKTCAYVCACGHTQLAHDVAEASGEGLRCCVDGCDCGHETRR